MIAKELDINFLWLELTGKCQLACEHCYADSGPTGTHGAMTLADWQRVITEGGGLGVTMVQFIGGEPTLHPHLRELMIHALDSGISVEVFSNFVHITDGLWELFQRAGVQLATSYYSADPAQHRAITGRRSHSRTRSNIVRALELNIPLRVGVIELSGDQGAERAMAELAELGVPADRIGYDRVRQVGRGTTLGSDGASVDQLCGRCTNGVLAISPNGEVWPCVFARRLPVGNARELSLPDILASPEFRLVRTDLGEAFARRADLPTAGCGPSFRCHPRCEPSCGPNNPPPPALP